MKIKNKIALNLSLLFSAFLGIILTTIYLLFAEFRKDEFVDILKDRIASVSTHFDEDQDDRTANYTKISSTPTYSIQEEEILMFNEKFELIFSSIKDKEVDWSSEDLIALKKEGTIYRRDKQTEIYGEKIGKHYFLIESEDILGKEKLAYLGTLMLISFLVASSFMWIFSFLFARKMMMPLDLFQNTITRISANNLNERLPVTENKDEINLLAKVFNTMLERINRAYSSQKEFTASASHEIKTPLTRMAFQLENLAKLEKENSEAKTYIDSISGEVYELSYTVNSLLLLSKLEEQHFNQDLTLVRMDDVVFDAFEYVKRNFEFFQLHFNIKKEDNEIGDLTVKGIKPLLDIVFINLFKNACLYSFRQEVDIEISENAGGLSAKITSRGNIISESDARKIFKAFSRGENSTQKAGSGLGLRICKRILDFHHATISYQSQEPDYNIFTIQFPAI